MAVAMLGCAIAPNAIGFAMAVAVFFPATGLATNLAEAALVEARPQDSERVMARWSLAGTIGDLAAPLVLYASSRLVGWRAALVATGALLGGWALVTSRLALTSVSGTNNEPRLSLRVAFEASFRNRKLLAWLAAAALCSLMDETLVAFGALLVSERTSVDRTGAVTVTLVAFGMGGAVGLLALDPIVARVRASRALTVACVGCAAAFAMWLVTRSLAGSAAWLFVTGAFACCIHPIAKAQAYRAAPGDGALVNGVAQIFAPLDLIAPIAIGLLADRYGLTTALCALLIQPIGVVAIAWAVSSFI
jgi:predicted MFS family arabinose efflux permease